MGRHRLLAGAAAMGLAASAQAGEVRVTVAEYSSETGPYFEEMARQFEEAHPDTDVVIEVTPWDVLLQKLTTDIAGGVNADLAIIGTRWLVDFVEQGVAEPLDPYIDDAFRDRFIETFLTPSVMDGQVYGLPIAASARALFYNETLFEQAGLDGPPETWEELRADAEAISALGEDVAGYGLQGKEIETDVYFYYPMWSYGGDILAEDGSSGLDSEAAVEAATLYKDMIDAGLTQDGPTAYSREDVQNLFKQGRVGMMITAPFLSGQIAEEAPDLAYGIAPIPAGPDGERGTYGVTDSIVMFANSDNEGRGLGVHGLPLHPRPPLAVHAKRGLPAGAEVRGRGARLHRGRGSRGLRRGAARRALRPRDRRLGGDRRRHERRAPAHLPRRGRAPGGARRGRGRGRPHPREVAAGDGARRAFEAFGHCGAPGDRGASEVTTAAAPRSRVSRMRPGPLPYLLVLPAFLLAALIVLWPLVTIANIAVHDVNRFGQLQGFSGAANLADLWADADFHAAAWRTLVWTGGVVGGTLALSVPIALVLDEDFHGRGLARVIVMLPWSVSLTMTAIVWRWALNGGERDAQLRPARRGRDRWQRGLARLGRDRTSRSRSPSGCWCRSRSP